MVKTHLLLFPPWHTLELSRGFKLSTNLNSSGHKTANPNLIWTPHNASIHFQLEMSRRLRSIVFQSNLCEASNPTGAPFLPPFSDWHNITMCFNSSTRGTTTAMNNHTTPRIVITFRGPHSARLDYVDMRISWQAAECQHVYQNE